MPLTHNTLMTLPLYKMIADANGLYFKCTGPQKGTWTFRYMPHGRARTMSLEPYPVVSLAEARKKLLQNRLLLSGVMIPKRSAKKTNAKRDTQKAFVLQMWQKSVLRLETWEAAKKWLQLW